MANKSARLVAIRIIGKVISGQSLTVAFEKPLKDLTLAQQSFVKALCFGVLRWFHQLDFILRLLLKKPLKSKDVDITLSLLCGLYELREMRTADYAVVSETVNTIKALKKPWASGLVNGVLRTYQRQYNDLEKQIQVSDNAFYSHPDWMIRQIKQDWPEQWQDILIANNQQPPLAVRVNRLRISRTAYSDLLARHDIAVHDLPNTEYGLTIENPMAPTLLPGFQEGLISVQDGAAQLAAPLLNLQPNLSVLDACAAPGGKTCLILEAEPSVKLVAMDHDVVRMQRLTQNLSRLKLQADVQVRDFMRIDAQPFDRILLDAPCSGSGVIRRHPDIKLLRREHDIVALSQLQHKMLTIAWSVLKSGGRLVYATCAIFKAENEQQIARFLTLNSDAQLTQEVRIFPGEQEQDGFYYACLEKT